MNRRGFLRALGFAPLAVPALAAMPKEPATASPIASPFADRALAIDEALATQITTLHARISSLAAAAPAPRQVPIYSMDRQPDGGFKLTIKADGETSSYVMSR